MPEPRKRGRPKKEAAPPAPAPKKRGRPKKVLAVLPPPKKRGRKPGVKAPSAKAPKPFSEHSVTGRLYLDTRPVSKQLPWVEDWKNRYYEAVSHNSCQTLLSLVDELNGKTNEFLEKNGNEMRLHIPKCALKKDEEVVKVLFDPVTRGAECTVLYRHGVVPIGLSPSMKATAVANKFTGAVKSYIPIGVC